MRSITLEFERLEASLRDAQEAAEEYWEAWIDAQTYWKTDRDEWKAEAKSLEREMEVSGQIHQTLIARFDAVKADGLLAEQDRDRLREALKRYGEHEHTCPQRSWPKNLPTERYACTCGLDEILT